MCREWYERAAEQDYGPAQTALGAFCLKGVGGPADARLAARWFHRAAEQREVDALHWLGNLCRDGVGGPVDLQGAAAWFAEAARLGSAPAATAYAEVTAALARAPRRTLLGWLFGS